MSALFHYCTVQTFHAIVSTGRVRLSSLRHANDETEGALVGPAVARVAMTECLTSDDRIELQNRACLLEAQFDGMALCLSEEGDLLSQWRGYADDGRGVAIGFNRAYLDELVRLADEAESSDDHLEVALYQAKYLEAEHDEAIKPLFNLLRSASPLPQEPGSDNEKLRELLKRLEGLQGLRLSLAAFDLVYSLKHRAFSEEREWRLVHHFDWGEARPAGYQPRPGVLVPYVELELRSASSIRPITEVVLGPRHTTPPDVIERFLVENKHEAVKVRTSSSPYRCVT